MENEVENGQSKNYSARTKEAILEVIPKKNCCKRIRQDMIALSEITDARERAQRIREVPIHFRCTSCFGNFAGVLFAVFGSVTDPDKQYHLELSFATEAEQDAAATVLSAGSIDWKRGTRKGRSLLYLKDSGKIEDFLALAGANRAAFDLMNAKIVREVRGDANRQMNCDMANIGKSLSAARQYIEVIEKLAQRGSLLQLPEDLWQTAQLRAEHTQASMTELGRLHNPPISKSGVKHRLDKIVSFYEGICREGQEH